MSRILLQHSFVSFTDQCLVNEKNESRDIQQYENTKKGHIDSFVLFIKAHRLPQVQAFSLCQDKYSILKRLDSKDSTKGSF
jgi:hypothetical protein